MHSVLTSSLPPEVHDALVDFADHAPQSGAVVLRGLPVGELPLTPDSPTARVTKDPTSEFVLLAAARRLGQPVGYLPEHGGDLVQNLVPTRPNAHRQVSTSSGVDLMFHTEAAFHPHRPRYLLLLCLRGDDRAVTTLSSILEVLPLLPWRAVETLFQPRFRTAVDESYLHGRQNVLGAPMPVLRGERHRPSMVFDADLMVVDNYVAVHGRSSYEPRWDGHDRWLQRSMVVSDLAPSAGERDGRVIVTHFGRSMLV